MPRKPLEKTVTQKLFQALSAGKEKEAWALLKNLEAINPTELNHFNYHILFAALHSKMPSLKVVKKIVKKWPDLLNRAYETDQNYLPILAALKCKNPDIVNYLLDCKSLIFTAKIYQTGLVILAERNKRFSMTRQWNQSERLITTFLEKGQCLLKAKCDDLLSDNGHSLSDGVISQKAKCDDLLSDNV